MRILILNGSPFASEGVAAMANAFAKGAKSAGHEVVELPVGTMNIKGCVACEYCHTKGEGQCVQKDDMDKVYPELREADMIVFLCPIHHFGLSPELQATIARIYALIKPNATKYGMLLLTAFPGSSVGIEIQYKKLVEYFGGESLGFFDLVGEEVGSEAALAKLEAFGASVK